MDKLAQVQPRGLSGMKIFTRSANWKVPDGVTAVRAYLFGSGGGGGGGSRYSDQGNLVYGGRGGSGGFFYGLIPVKAGSNIDVRVGAGGAGAKLGGVNMGNPPAGENGHDGEATSFGRVVVGGGKGGVGGVWGPGGGGNAAGWGGSEGTLTSPGTLRPDAYIFVPGFRGQDGKSNSPFLEFSEADNHFIFRNWNSPKLNYSLSFCLGGNGGVGAGADGFGYQGMNGLIIIEY